MGQLVLLGLGLLVMLMLAGALLSSRYGWCALMIIGMVVMFLVLLVGSVVR